MQPEAKALSQLEKDTLQTISQIGTFSQLGSIFDDAKKYYHSVWLEKGCVDAHLTFEVAAGLRWHSEWHYVLITFFAAISVSITKSFNVVTASALPAAS